MIIFKEIINSDLYKMFTEGGYQLWSTGRVRKNKKCAECNDELKGQIALIPITNQNNRGDRLCLKCLNLKIKLEKSHGKSD